MKTPQQSYPELAGLLGIPEIYLKREDLHKYGSHKGRSIPLMIKKYAKSGPHTPTVGGPYNNFVISSSGNAALAAIMAVQAHNVNNVDKINLKVFVGQNINEQKLKIILASTNDPHVTIEQVENPRQQAFQVDKNGEAKFLRQSTDDLALEGYFELAEDLNKIENLEAVFIPTSSGTTAQAIGQSFLELGCKAQIHIVQTTACHPMAEEFDKNFASTENSCAEAIVDNIAHRKEKIIETIKNSQGSGWVADDKEIKSAIALVEDACNIKISSNSALSIAGLTKAVNNSWKFSGPVVCLITGR